jgi:hypothetical protein
MADESLAVLRDAFDAWRRRKRHAREAIPGDLMARARARPLDATVRPRCVERRECNGIDSWSLALLREVDRQE